MIEERLKQVLEEFCREQNAQPADYRIIVERNLFDRFHAVLIWSGFDNMEVSERQKKIWDFVDKRMRPSDLRKISIIRTRGPREWTEQEELAIHMPPLPWS